MAGRQPLRRCNPSHALVPESAAVIVAAVTENTIAAGRGVSAAGSASGTTFAVILSLSFCHFLNDMMQSLVPAMYPVLKDSYDLSFAQVGLITLAFQCTASLLQPLVGLYTDRKPQPYSLALGMGFTLVGLALMAHAHSYPVILIAAALIGMGSAVFHPESSRMARAASGGRYGLAQSLFQVGGNVGSASGPLLAAFIVVPAGQESIIWFSAAAFLAMFILVQVGGWYGRWRAASGAVRRAGPGAAVGAARELRVLTRGKVALAVAVLVALLFSKNVYSASLGSYFPLYLMSKFDTSIQLAQVFLFAFMVGTVLGTLAGGAVGDKVGRIPVMWFSILGPLPLTLAMPYVGLWATGILAVLVAFIMASAFSAILVYAQELMPGRVGMVAGMFFGFSFGLGGLGAAALGQIADWTSIETVYRVCSFLPLLGLLTAFLPKLPQR
jgi:MFS transporter, FSR family, fosmidomycin resistance protein